MLRIKIDIFCHLPKFFLTPAPFRLMIFEGHANLKYKYGSRNFWCRGYYVDTVGRNKKIIAEYIRNQLEEDYAADQISIK